MKVGVPSAKLFLARLATMTLASAIGSAIQRKLRGRVMSRESRKMNHFSHFE